MSLVSFLALRCFSSEIFLLIFSLQTFTKWVDSHLKKKGQRCSDIETDLSDGLKLISLLEVRDCMIFRCPLLTVPVCMRLPVCYFCLYFHNKIQVIGDETSLGRHNKNPKMRIQKVENVNVALTYLQKKGIQLVGISAESKMLLSDAVAAVV